ncbi:MAG: hypothetical protein A2784_02550 [Candidatus Chisholmbacteria bacterium RIFCSPHIGHO2_01_FULL_48_12]|uniref:Probable inosine/xanthosine triphosphatase n=1 Tax=Candidatus Chisholmbacteria bacterium RIFCSPHIGHO2_01_FULL_48_12 TaxID=1797589 RepID=A0A1G1VUU2_9BACT|nr:MAG: hypothetical protein A2784_02550 [Candidatus Chisholmbacteria bacterium RIFCSPHIGHO2_01_FULL_48_12]
MKVAVGSKNPVKIEAVKLAFEQIWPQRKWQVMAIEVKHGITDQPMSDRESIRGAKNRARRALKKLGADFGVGLEGGLQKIGQSWFDCGWAVVVDKQGRVGMGSTARMIVPQTIMRLIKQGKELGEALDKVWNRANTKQAEGHFGLMTNKVITRTQGYRDGMIMALARFIQPHLF